MPAGSKMDLPLDKAEPISDGGSDAGIIDFKKGKEYCATAESYAGAGDDHEVEAAAETRCYEQAMSPIPYLLAQPMVLKNRFKPKNNDDYCGVS
ncbi:hypothetical protein HGM15179_010160 [Zosterops borbonicus]|uniref:Uncharacterized protein n=1 Tax=Zosterops borbonicus TaxID=364589 RepID=A0A8K1LK55_9PASS|nr:hypothetical protein HGM15179_010160 [Zosterops borbonicus]